MGKYSNDKVRENLSKSRFDNYDVQDVARKLRTDSDYRYKIEKDMRRGRTFEDAILESQGKPRW